MDDLASILASHQFKGYRKQQRNDAEIQEKRPIFSEIPDIFFDEILVSYKLGRTEILVLMYFYRKIWCRPNLYQSYGIGPLLSLREVALHLKLEMLDVQSALQKLENLGLIETIRSGQYFIRKYFTENHDLLYGQSYDDF